TGSGALVPAEGCLGLDSDPLYFRAYFLPSPLSLSHPLILKSCLGEIASASSSAISLDGASHPAGPFDKLFWDPVPCFIKEDITTTRYSIGGLSPNSEYEIWVSAVNSIGQGPPSESVVTRTGEQAPASAPRNVQGRMLSSTSPGWDGAPQFQSQDLPTLHFAADVLFPHRLGKKTGKEPPS
uniref:Fibronectin type-III domain-containing protein n=1 Tax=Malurus cyaneus samueli TaxID=2593467 RepID=A0A8C5TVU3_9PASS